MQLSPLNCFCHLFFIMVVTGAISFKLIVLWKLYPSCPFTMLTLFCRSHFIWLLVRIITAIRDSLGNARVVYICEARCACARYSSRAKTAKKIPVFCTFLRNPFTDFDDSLEPSSGFSLPFLCISRRLDQKWGSLLQTLPHTHTITQIIVRFVDICHHF